MNLEREDKIELIATFDEIIAALRHLYPEEFLLRQFTQIGGTTRPAVKGEIVGSGVRLTCQRRVPGGALGLRRLGHETGENE